MESQDARLKLLLELTSAVVSNLHFRELLRTISGSVRRVMACDTVGIALPAAEPGKFRVHALDFPESKGFIREELLLGADEVTVSAFEKLQPAVNVPSGDLDPHFIGEGIRCSSFIPLVSRGRSVGLLGLGRREETLFGEDEVEFLRQAAGPIAIAVDNALAYREISELRDRLAQEKLYLEEEIRSEMRFEQIIGKSPALMRVLELVETVAPSDSTVLLLGETGTGKELIARAIHDHSQRQQRTFVKLNCAAIPTGLLESELFGHERGAFTGAISQKLGRMELADQGTLFLDEVGDIPVEIQPKLLRALQEREFERLGSTHTRKVNIRMVAATNRNLEEMIAAGKFRSDLFYRLNVFPIRIPPLRERREDIPLLVRYFVQKLAKQMQKPIETIPSSAMKALTSWDWPGNIRELENVIERSVILTRGKSLEVPLAELRTSATPPVVRTSNGEPEEDKDRQESDEIRRMVRQAVGEIKGATPSAARVTGEREEKQRQKITAVLLETRGRVGGPRGAAAQLGLNRTTLISRMKRLGIDSRDFS